MPSVFFMEPLRLPAWSPWSEWLESGGGGESRCLRLPCPSVKRTHELAGPPRHGADAGKRVCRRHEQQQQEGPVSGFREAVRVAGYRPDEVRVRVSAHDGLVTVSACHRERAADGFSQRRLVRRVQLPRHVQAARLTCRLTPEGTLLLEAPAARRVITVPVTCHAPDSRHSGTDVTVQRSAGEDEERRETEKTDACEKVGEKETEKVIEKDTEKAQDQTEETKEDEEEKEVQEERTPEPREATVPAAEQEVPVEVTADADSRSESSEHARDAEPQEPADDAADTAEPAAAEPAAADSDGRAAEAVAPEPEVAATVSSAAARDCVLASVDVRGFRAEEVSVRVGGRQLCVEALHEEAACAAHGGSCQLRLVRRISLPEHVDTDLVTSRLTRAGQLIIQAPPAAPSA